MTIVLQSKPGLSSTTTLSIPKDWSATWFRSLINNQLKGADVRNAVGSGGIVVSGTIASPYATIGFGAPVTLPGPVTINPPASGTTLIVKESPSSGSNIDLWAAAPNGTSIIRGLDSTGTTRVGYLEFISGTGGGGGATETLLDNDGTTVNDWLSFVTNGTRRVRIDGTGAVTINAPPASVVPLTVNGPPSNTFPLFLVSNAAADVSGIVFKQSGTLTAEMGADGTQNMWSGSTNGDFVLRQISGSIWIVVSSTTLALQISSTGAIDFHSVATTTTSPAAGGAGALPATPAGYATFSIGGVARKIAYY